MNYAVVLRETKQFDKAFEIMSALRRDFPHDKDLAWDRAFVGMYISRGPEAWQMFDARFDAGKIPYHPVMASVPRWQGEDLDGKHIYLMREQGGGDTILMLRYIPRLKKTGAKITLECKPELERLTRRLPVDGWAEPGRTGEDKYDYYCALMSLPGHLSKQGEDIPGPYPLAPPEEARKEISQRLKIPKDDKLNVGVVWSGSVTFAGNGNRSVRVERFLDLAVRLPQCRFVSLQKGPRRNELCHSGGDTLIRDLSGLLEDFAATAAVIEHLDLILMTDSAVVHVAGAMGRPVLDLLQYTPCWFYMPEIPTTGWYPSVRFLRQETPGQWGPVFKKAEFILGRLASAKAKSGPLTPADVPGKIDRAMGELIQPSS